MLWCRCVVCCGVGVWCVVCCGVGVRYVVMSMLCVVV